MHIKKKLNLNKLKLSLPEILKSEAVFFDIETTGLSNKTSDMIIAGLAFNENSSFVIEQYFSDITCSKNPYSEKQLILFISKIFNVKKYIITFNGNSFDIPFYLNKCVQHGVANNLNGKILLDLYINFKILDIENKFENLKQKSLENYYNIKRTDTLSGKDISKLYESYKINPKSEYKDLLLNHNYEDVVNLIHLFTHFNQIHSNKIFKSKFSNTYNLFHLKNSQIKLNKTLLKFKIKSLPEYGNDIIINSFLYKIYWNKKSGEIHSEFIVQENNNYESEKIIFIDLKKYGISQTSNNLLLSKNNIFNHKNLIELVNLLISKNLNL
jgi:uncharacterized protein YprB with RNaseH-like and TPR domain